MARAGSAGDESAAASPAIRAIGLRRTYGQVVALERLHLDIRAGEFFTMLGPSGSGKTTTLRLIAGFERPDSGALELDGVDVTDRPPYLRDVNTVFQDYALFPHMNVLQNVAYGLRVRRAPKAEQKRRAEEALNLVGLGGLEGRKPVQLSGGQRQRVALARALVNRPRVLLLDEPLGALDLKLRQQMQLELKSIQRELGGRVTFVYVTHDQDEALTMSDRLAVMANGRIEQIGTPAEVYERPASEFVAGFVGTSNLIDHGGRRCTLRPEKVHIVDDAGQIPPGMDSVNGEITEVAYLGAITRFLVQTDDGRTLTAVRQNLDLSAQDAAAQRGRRVWLAWRPEHLTPVDSGAQPTGGEHAIQSR
jgi:putative spermidine/putrescine transport system ATP-binding protein